MILLSEVLSMMARLKKSQIMRKNKAKISMGKKKAERVFASPEKLMKRATKHARNLIISKLLKGVAKADVSVARKMDIEKRLDTPAMQAKIKKLATKLLPQIRKAEMEKKSHKSDDNQQEK